MLVDLRFSLWFCIAVTRQFNFLYNVIVSHIDLNKSRVMYQVYRVTQSKNFRKKYGRSQRKLVFFILTSIGPLLVHRRSDEALHANMYWTYIWQ